MDAFLAQLHDDAICLLVECIYQFICLFYLQWIQSLLSPVSKLKGTYRQAYGLERSEPLVCFAICCGGRSDPPVIRSNSNDFFHCVATSMVIYFVDCRYLILLFFLSLTYMHIYIYILHMGALLSIINTG